MNRKSYPTDLADNPTNLGNSPKTKVWIWSAIGLLITNLVVVGIVAFLIHRDSVQSQPNQPAIQQRQL
ncbi:hypothetical protein [Nostoc sp. 106C]|uniref:hypothetical protein n=1 Tax=Nostoc sp. 106C TaxID=1932667 RepID=UPI000A3CCDAA|nr:hypothetical protein [Nostoc sp. 106C]OUL27930.1 hypothetical protein BV378_09275 [Nostoc sp. RF31YmG]OUL33173.1 hypothetical protein BV375_07965 [Nostoc sp. 106C]